MNPQYAVISILLVSALCVIAAFCCRRRGFFQRVFADLFLGCLAGLLASAAVNLWDRTDDFYPAAWAFVTDKSTWDVTSAYRVVQNINWQAPETLLQTAQVPLVSTFAVGGLALLASVLMHVTGKATGRIRGSDAGAYCWKCDLRTDPSPYCPVCFGSIFKSWYSRRVKENPKRRGDTSHCNKCGRHLRSIPQFAAPHCPVCSLEKWRSDYIMHGALRPVDDTSKDSWNTRRRLVAHAWLLALKKDEKPKFEKKCLELGLMRHPKYDYIAVSNLRNIPCPFIFRRGFFGGIFVDSTWKKETEACYRALVNELSAARLEEVVESFRLTWRLEVMRETEGL